MKVSLSSDHIQYSIEDYNGAKAETWTFNGQLHNVDDQPAWVVNDGEELKWFVHGDLHRDEALGPAYIRVPQKEYFYFNLNVLHRRLGPALITYERSAWYLNGDKHRTDGPAIALRNGTQEWYQFDRLHRIDGPAVILSNGMMSWYLRGLSYKFNEWLEETPLDDERKLLLKLQYG
jgi:hypothetical protein